METLERIDRLLGQRLGGPAFDDHDDRPALHHDDRPALHDYHDLHNHNNGAGLDHHNRPLATRLSSR